MKSLVFLLSSFAIPQPNIVLINIDDLGYADISPFGGKTATPNLDRMAKEGMKLTSHYAAPVCSPSRAAMMTGCYPKRVLPIPGVLFPACCRRFESQRNHHRRGAEGRRLRHRLHRQMASR
jgi:arylsulfatase A